MQNLHIPTQQMQSLAKAIDKDNAQTSKEWDAFTAKHPQNWDDMPAEAKAEAMALVERQGTRWQKLITRLGLLNQ